MKQIIQNYRTGVLELADVPIPICSVDKILVKNIASLISIGMEGSIIELEQKSFWKSYSQNILKFVHN